MFGGAGGAAHIVGDNQRGAGADDPSDRQHHRQPGVQPGDFRGIGVERRTQDQPGGAVFAHRAHDFGLAHHVLGRVGDEGNEPRILQRALDADGELGEKGIAEIVDHHADDVGSRPSQAGRAPVVDVAKRVHRPGHALTGFILDERTFILRTSDTVDFDTPGLPGDIDNSGRPRCGPGTRHLGAPILFIGTFHISSVLARQGATITGRGSTRSAVVARQHLERSKLPPENSTPP